MAYDHAVCLLLCLQENPDLFKWLTGQQQAPQELQQNPAYQVCELHAAAAAAAVAAAIASASSGRRSVTEDGLAS